MPKYRKQTPQKHKTAPGKRPAAGPKCPLLLKADIKIDLKSEFFNTLSQKATFNSVRTLRATTG